MENEAWRGVVGYESSYEISSIGRLKNIESGKMRKQQTDYAGYKYYRLCVNQCPVIKKTHRLVAEAFLPNPDGKRTVNHINGNKADNSLNNLEWCTHSENNKKAHEIGLKSQSGARNNFSKVTVKMAKEIFELNKKGWPQWRIGKKFQIAQGHVSKVLNKPHWTDAHIT